MKSIRRLDFSSSQIFYSVQISNLRRACLKYFWLLIDRVKIHEWEIFSTKTFCFGFFAASGFKG